MSYIQFNNSTKKIQNGIIIPLADTGIEVQGANRNTSGVKLYLNNGLMVGDYSDYTIVIGGENTTFQYSNGK